MAFFRDTQQWDNLHSFFRRHWQRLLRIRQKIWFSEEAFHLVLAAGVGLSRTLLDRHFPSDVVLGSGLGALIGWKVCTLRMKFPITQEKPCGT